MVFYEVKSSSDQTRFNGSILISKELWTDKELNKVKANDDFKNKHFNKVEVSKFKTYWFFGARFKCKLND